MFDTGQLTFEPGAHLYSVGVRVLPSVTQCLKNSRIVDYSHIPQEVLQNASARGRIVHRIVEFDLTGGVDPASISVELVGYYYAFKKFQEESGLVAEKVECRVFDLKYGYAGTFDVIGKFANGDEVIVDWKTGILLPGHQIQMAGYAHGTEEPKRRRRIIVQLRKDGEYRQVEAQRSDYPRHFATFAGAVTTMAWRMEHERHALAQIQKEAA